MPVDLHGRKLVSVSLDDAELDLLATGLVLTNVCLSVRAESARNRLAVGRNKALIQKLEHAQRILAADD